MDGSLPPHATRSTVRASGAHAQRLISWGSVLVVLVAWEVAVRLGHISPLYLPGPIAILRSLIEQFRDGGLALDCAITLYRIFAGFAVAVVLGVLLGVWMATTPVVAGIADLFIAALYPLPKITLIPLLMIWFGTGGGFMLTISAMGAFFPVVINTLLGVRQCDPGLVLAARDLGASPRQVVARVLIPSALPAIFAGMRLGLGVSIILVVAAEMVAPRAGLGARLFLAGQVLDTEQVFAVLIVLAAIGIVLGRAQDWLDLLVARSTR
jgi:NitT/TauT family transport system permease protein